MKPHILCLALAAGLAGCASNNTTVVTTTSPPKCFYDSNLNRQRCMDAIAYGGHAKQDHRGYNHQINTGEPVTGAIYGSGNRKRSGYAFGFSAPYEAGYRTASRFDTTIYHEGDRR